MTTPREMTLREVVALAHGLLVMDGEVRLGFIASSREAARCTGLAVAKMLAPYGVTWHPADESVSLPSGAAVAFLSIQDLKWLRRFRWAATFLSAPANATAAPDVVELLAMNARPPGAGIILCAEVTDRGHLEDLLRQAA